MTSDDSEPNFFSTQYTVRFSRSIGNMRFSANVDPGSAAQHIVVVHSIMDHSADWVNEKVGSSSSSLSNSTYRLIDMEQVL